MERKSPPSPTTPLSNALRAYLKITTPLEPLRRSSGDLFSTSRAHSKSTSPSSSSRSTSPKTPAPSAQQRSLSTYFTAPRKIPTSDQGDSLVEIEPEDAEDLGAFMQIELQIKNGAGQDPLEDSVSSIIAPINNVYNNNHIHTF